MAKKLQILLEVKSDGTVAIDKVVGQLGRVGDEAEKAGAKTRSLNSDFASFASKGGQLAGSVLSAIAGASAAVAGLSAAVVGVGVRHNAQLEQSRLAMAALASSMGEITDGNGRVLAGQERWNAALAISESLVKKLQLAAIQTTAEFGDLVRVMQEGMGPALQAGFDEQQIVKFTQLIAQMGGALGIAGDRLGQEIRAVLAGEKGPDNQIANALFGDMTDVKAKLAELRKSGELFDFLEKKMAAFAKAGEVAGDTFDGALSNLKDAITQALGEATQGATSDFTRMLKELTAEIVTFDEAGRAVFDEQFVAGVRDLATAFTQVAGAGVELVKSIPKFGLFFESLAEWRRENDALIGFGAQFANPANLLMPKNPIKQLNQLNELGNKGYVSLDDILVKNIREQRERELMAGRSLEQELEATGAVSSLDSGRRPATLGAKPGGAGGGGDDKVAERMRKQLDDYRKWVEDAKAIADSAGDPLEEALAKIESDRREAIDKIEAANKGIAGALALSDEAKAAQNAIADQKAIDTLVKEWEKGLAERNKAIEQADQDAAESAAAMGEILTGIQEQVEADRIATIEDSVERERQTRLAANDEWYQDALAKAQAEIKNDEDRLEVYEELAKEKQRLDDAVNDHAEKLRKESLAGTEEWARKVRASIKQNLGNVANDMAGVFSDSTMALRGAFDDLFAGIVEGQVDVADTLKNLGKSLGNIWGQMLSSMLTRTLATGESIMSQLKGMWDSLGQATGVDAAMGGAGIGSLVGGLGAAIMGPGNYAAEGGTIGGAIGAVIGSYFGATQIGAIIGSAIGTAVGGAISKDGDWIKVAIKDGILTVTEEGLSAEGRAQLTRELKRAVSQQVKGWNSILELFPAQMQDELRSLVKPLDIAGGIEGGDIKDSGAMHALSDFINDTLNRNLFMDYIMAIEKGLQGLGVSDERIKQMFAEWGSLQGEELQGAVREYIETLVESVRVRDLFNPFEASGGTTDLRGVARDVLAAQKPEARIKAMIADLGELVEALPDLDPSDQIAAMQQVNQLGQQIWDNMIAQLQRIDAIQQSIAQSAQSMRDQVTLAGLDDQGKMDFYFDHLGDIREQMSTATDPEEINRLYQQAMGYISSALALDPDNPELRDKLMGIIGDLEGVAGEQLNEARDRVMEEQLAAYELLSQAAQTLLDAASAMPGAPTAPPPATEPPDPEAPKPTDPRDPFGPLTGSAKATAEELDALAAAVVVATGALEGGASADKLDAMLQQLVGFGGGSTSASVQAAFASALATSLAASPLAFATMLGYAPPAPAAGAATGANPARIEGLLAQILAAQQAQASAGSRVELSGPGVDFMKQVGVAVHASVVRDLRNNRRQLVSAIDG